MNLRENCHSMQPDWPYLQLSIHTSIDLQDKVPQLSTGFTFSFNICYDLTFMARQHETCNKTIEMTI